MTMYAAKGSKFKRSNNASPETFSDVAQVRSIEGPGMKQEAVDLSHHGSAAREYGAGLVDSGEVSLVLLFDPGDGTHDANSGLIADLTVGGTGRYQIEFPDGSTATFTALVTECAPSAPHDGALTANVSLKVSGSVTWA